MRARPSFLMILCGLALPNLLAIAATPVEGQARFLTLQTLDEQDVPGLAGALDVEASADGQFFYVVGQDAAAVTVFRRDPFSGILTHLQTLQQGSGGVEGLEQVQNLVLSPDGRYLYTSSLFNGAVAIFERHQVAGTLRFIGTNREFVQQAAALAMSPDGRHVYAAMVQGGVAAYVRELESGLLTFIQSFALQETSEAVAVSPDGRQVLTVSSFRGSLKNYRRDLSTGLLTLIEALVEGEGGVQGLDGPMGLRFDPLGNGVYVLSSNRANDGGTVSYFVRDVASGLFTLSSMVAGPRSEAGSLWGA
ncbi:MAG: beta-propeller fold lactonase family protein, partial [Acidobacteria bacterium]|nr:beta-propeller fold lactonase family protein [Acidobacteriota bacterium]